MPHKHKRDKSKTDLSFYDLPPSKRAQALPTSKSTSTNTDGKRSITNTKPNLISYKRKHASMQDDTPRAFTRLLTGYRPPRSGLDDGNRPSKKQKPTKLVADENTAPVLKALPTPTIQPFEPLSLFGARVDAALPFSGLTKKGGGGKEGKERQTKTERKMQRMYREWREQDRRRKEKREEEADEKMDEGEEEVLAMKKGKRKSGKKKRGGPGNGQRDDDDEDPWAHIQAKPIDEVASRAGLVGLHDVVLAPPKFSKVPRGKKDLNIGKGEGGLKRQAELAEARRSVVEGYRQMMSQKRISDG
ncbi:hypothetical protein P7C71_g4509, partial [Lecanoromycetidae sp. Uapishka_2]